MAQTTAEKYAKALKEAILNGIGKDELVESLIKHYSKDVSPQIKTDNFTSDKDVADLFNIILISKKPITTTTYGLATDWPTYWKDSARNYNIDYSFWFDKKKLSKAYIMFEFLKTVAKDVPSVFSKLTAYLKITDDKELEFTNMLSKMQGIVDTGTETDKKQLFEALAKDKDINDIMYVYTAIFTGATDVMFFDAILGYLMLSSFWLDGWVIGQNKLNQKAPGMLGGRTTTWSNKTNLFRGYSNDIIQETFRLLEEDPFLRDTTKYKALRKAQLVGDTTAEIQMLVYINEKFNYNCDKDFDGDRGTNTYRTGFGLAYKGFKITTPEA
ncbi:unannotated protein [freshwater metagenome]|uniref:Unannotated protein n=1 Tax=freshwater metagenome TaxID=449393 RepID=A0A6J7ITU4_9ZZZZ|nr:hypothetical protein [Actinomycetota bacterium]